MAFQPAEAPKTTKARIAALDMACQCGWEGKGAECRVARNDYVRCPKCNRPVVMKEVK